MRAVRLARRHEDLAARLVQKEGGSKDELVKRLGGVGDINDIEMFLDTVSDRAGLPTSRFGSYYDAAGITEHYLEVLEHSKSWNKRAFAAEKLGMIGSVKAVPLLLSVIRNVKDEDEDVRGAALRSLGRIRDESAIPFLIEALGFPETWLPPRVGEILVSIGDASIAPLIRELKDFQNESRRIWAAEILGWLGAKSAAVPLIDSLSDVCPEVRAKAAGALGKLKDSRSLGKLLELLVSDPVPFVRARVSQALGSISDASIIDYLITILKDPEWWVRVRAVEALEHMGEKAIPALLISLDDEDSEVRRRAAMTLERNGYVEKILEEYEQEKFHPELKRILLLVARAGVIKCICEKLATSEGKSKKRIIRLLGEAEVKEAYVPLIELLEESTDWTVTARIIQCLGRIGVKETVPHLVKHLKNSKYWVRRSTVETLKQLEAKEAAESIAALLDDPSSYARESALIALAELKITDYKSKMHNLLSDPHPRVRAAAVRVMREMYFLISDAIKPQLLTDPSEEVKIESVRYYAAKSDSSVHPVIIKLLHRGSKALKSEIVEYVRKAQIEDFDRLLGLLNRDRLTNRTLVSLIEIASIIKDASASEFIVDHLSHRDPQLRAAAYQALRPLDIDAHETMFAGGLSDPSDIVRIAVLGSMATAPKTNLLNKARPLSQDPVENVRLALALALGASGCVEFTGLLVEMLDDSSQRVVSGALMSLASFDDPALVKVIKTKKSLKSIRNEIVAIREETQFHSIVEKIVSGAEMSDNLEVKLLLTHNEKEFAASLIRRVKEALDPKIRAKALDILKIIASDEEFISLLGILKKDPSHEVRIKAMEILASMNRDDEVIPAIVSMLVDPSINVKIRAAELLGEFKNPHSLEALLLALDTSDRQFREALSTSLSRLLIADPENMNDLIKSIPESKTRKLGMTWVMGKTRKRGAFTFLRELLSDNDPDVRASAVGALTKYRNKRLFKYLEKMIYDPNERVRAAAVNAISTVGGDRAFEILEKALDDIDEYVRNRAAIGLARISLDNSIAVLKKKSDGFSELGSYLNGIQYAAGRPCKSSLKDDAAARCIVDELCPKEDMLMTLRSSPSEAERLHALQVLTDVHRYNARKLRNIVQKDPSPEVREKAEKIVMG